MFNVTAYTPGVVYTCDVVGVVVVVSAVPSPHVQTYPTL